MPNFVEIRAEMADLFTFSKCACSGVASVEQMEQLLPTPRNTEGHICNSRKSEEIFSAKGCMAQGYSQLILRKIIKIVATRSNILRL